MPSLRSVLPALALSLIVPLAVGAQSVLPDAAAQLARASRNRGPVFVENRGQWDARARFLARLPGLDAWVTDSGIVYDYYRADRLPAASDADAAARTSVNGRRGHVGAMRFVASRGSAIARPGHRARGYHNYFIGSDPGRWARHVPTFAEVSIDHVYDGVDARLMFDDGALRYDLFVAPHADPSRVALEFDGFDGVRVDASGELVLSTSLGEVRHRGLEAFQIVDGAKRAVACRFVPRSDGTIGFDLGRYDRARPLVIDPIVWSMYFGHSGESSPAALAVDSAGNVFITGTVYSAGYPTTPGAYDGSFNTSPPGWGTEAVVTRINGSDQSNEYSTYLGGELNEFGGRIVINRQGEAYVALLTNSLDFPTTAGAFDRTCNAPVGDTLLDVAIVRLDRTGSSLVYSTYLGGKWSEEAVDIVIDGAGRAFVAGATLSPDFPTTSGVIFPNPPGGFSDAYLSVLSADGGSLVFSTYLGGNDDDVASSVGLDSIGAAYVAGYTQSQNFPKTTGVLDSVLGGSQDAFITKINPAGTVVMYSTLLGGSATEGVAYIQVGELGDVYIAGLTSSADFPVTSGSFQETFGDQYVAHINPTARSFYYSTFLGRAANRMYAVALGRAGFFHIVGLRSFAGQVSGAYPTTEDAVSRTYGGGAGDAYVTIVRPSGSTLAYSTYLGGNGFDVGFGIGLDRIGDLYVSGGTTSTNFPGTTDTLSGLTDFFITKIQRCFARVNAGADRTICLGDSILIGAPATLGVPPYRYRWSGAADAPAVDTVRFWAKPTVTSAYIVTVTDTLGCEAIDTIVINVNATPAVSAGRDTSICIGSMVPLRAVVAGGRAPYTYRWDSAAGLSDTSIANPRATPIETTTYAVTVTDANGCRTRSSVVVTVTRPPVLLSGSDYEICVGDSATLGVTISEGSGPFTYRWSPGASLSDPTAPAPYAFPTATTQYIVTVTDTNGCSTSDTLNVVVGTTLRTSITANRSLKLCAGDSVTLDAGDHAEYLWSSGQTTRRITVADPGRYSVAIRSVSGCEGTSDTVTVTAAARPNTSVSGPLRLCMGSTGQYVSAESRGVSYRWRIAGTSGVIESQIDDTLRVLWQRAGIDTVYLVVTSSDGCIDSTRLAVTVTAGITTTITASGDLSLCAGDSVTLDAGYVSRYRWSNGATTRTIVVRDAGSYWVDIEIEDTSGHCGGRSDTVIVVVRPVPTPSITAFGTRICPGDSTVLSADAGYASYSWSNGASGQSIVVTTAGRYRVTVVDADGCVGISSEVEVVVHPAPATPTITVSGDTLVASAAAAWQWFRDGERIDSATSQRLVRTASGTYAVEITDSNGCRARASLATAEGHLVWMDTVSATVGERFRLACIVAPAARAADAITRFNVRLRHEPTALFAHSVRSPIAGAPAPAMSAGSDGVITILYDGTQPLVGDTLFTIEMQGLSTASPVNVVRLESVSLGGGGSVTIAGDGLVLLDGCDVGRFAFGKGARITRTHVDRSQQKIVVEYHAPGGSRPQLTIFDLTGRAIASRALDAGNDATQVATIDLPATGVYVIELRDRDERSSAPIIVTR